MTKKRLGDPVRSRVKVADFAIVAGDVDGPGEAGPQRRVAIGLHRLGRLALEKEITHAWVERLRGKHGAACVKQQLADVRMLFNWLIIGQVVPANPASAVRGAAYLDILIHRRIWNVHAIDYSTIQYSMFLVMREIRGKTPAALAKILRKRLDDDPENFASNDSFRLHGKGPESAPYPPFLRSAK